ncbi:MAG TPA: hypothetical protein VGA36_02865 [Nitriliruptorales bacterium]
MPPADDPGSLAPDEAERLHLYVAAFLSPAAADEALHELTADLAGAGGTATDRLRVARRHLLHRVDVPMDLEVAVLIEDVGVDPGDVATVLDVPRETVEAIIEREGIVVAPAPTSPAPTSPAAPSQTSSASTSPAEPSPAPASPAAPPAPAGPEEAPSRPAMRTALLGVLGLLLVVIVVVAIGGGGRGPDTGLCEPSVEQPVCVADARVTDVVDASGSPGAPRASFEVGESVKLWFAFETLERDRGYVVDYVWYRGGQPLYAADFRLPPVGRVNLTLARQFATERGDYAVEVRNGDDVLVDKSFSIG